MQGGVGIFCEIRHPKSFMVIGRDQRRGMIRGEIADLWIDQDRNTLVSKWQNLSENTRCHHPLVVIRHYQSVRILNRRLQSADNPILGLRAYGHAEFSVGTNNELAVSNDAG